FSLLSHRNDAPERASRPFDRQRDGTVLSEGGGVLLLEELEHAHRRGAKIYAEVVGFGAAFDRARDGKGIARAIRAALQDAGIGPEEIDHVNAHGASTPESDAWEARGIAEVFGNCAAPPAVFAPKSYFGNLGAAGPITELIASLLAQQNRFVPRTLNYDEPDSSCPIPVLQTAQEVRKPHVLKVSL